MAEEVEVFGAVGRAIRPAEADDGAFGSIADQRFILLLDARPAPRIRNIVGQRTVGKLDFTAQAELGAGSPRFGDPVFPGPGPTGGDGVATGVIAFVEAAVGERVGIVAVVAFGQHRVAREGAEQAEPAGRRHQVQGAGKSVAAALARGFDFRVLREGVELGVVAEGMLETAGETRALLADGDELLGQRVLAAGAVEPADVAEAVVDEEIAVIARERAAKRVGKNRALGAADRLAKADPLGDVARGQFAVHIGGIDVRAQR